MIVRRLTRRDLPAVALAANLALLFGVAVWLRTTSLESLPEPNGDESWYGVQAGRIIRGLPFAPRTPNGNPLNPFHVGTEALLLLAFRPSFWILRVSSAASGIAAVVLAYVLGRKVLDRGTALLAAGVLAVLPIAIHYSRLGYDCSQTPLFSVLALYWAWNGNGRGLLLGYALCLVAHPSNLFLLPVLLAVYLSRTLSPCRDRGAVGRAVVTTAGGLALAAALAIYQRRLTREFLKIRQGDALLFLKRYANLLVAGPCDANRLQVGIVLAVVLLGIVIGAWRLAVTRRWDRLAMLGGLVLGASACFVTVGSDTFPPIEQRYGLFLVVPTAFAAACVIRGLLIVPTGRVSAAARSAQVACLLAAGWALLFCFGVNRCDPRGPPPAFGLWRDKALPPRAAFPPESLASFGTDRPDSKAVAFRVILHDVERRPGGRRGGTVILAQDWWTYRPLQYLAGQRPEIAVVEWSKVPFGTLDSYKRRFQARLRGGAYVVCFSDQFLERFVQDEFPADQIRRWEVPAYGGPYLTILRLKDGREGFPDPGATTAERPGAAISR